MGDWIQAILLLPILQAFCVALSASKMVIACPFMGAYICAHRKKARNLNLLR